MHDQAITHDTFVIKRNYSTIPERVFAALSDPAKKRRWFAESDHHDVENFEMDFRVGGKENSLYRFKPGTPFAGVELSSDAVYFDIVPDRRIVVASTMEIGGRRISAALATFELLSAQSGTDLIFTHQAVFFEGADGPTMRQQGWEHLLGRLANDLGA